MTSSPTTKPLELFAMRFSKSYSEWTTETHRDLPDTVCLLTNRTQFEANVIGAALSALGIKFELIQFWGCPFLMVAMEQVKSNTNLHLISCSCVVPPESPAAVGSSDQANFINGLCLAKEIAESIFDEETIVSCGIVTLFTSDVRDCVTGSSARYFDCVYSKSLGDINRKLLVRSLRHFYKSISTSIGTISQYL